MKKFRLLATLLVVALCTTTIFTSCRNGDDENGNGGNAATVTATNVIGTTSGIATARATVWETDSEFRETIVQAPFQNRGFTLQLPTPPSRLLHPFAGGNIPTGITISDNTVRMASVDFRAYNSAGDDIGYFYFANWSWANDELPNDGTGALWLYVDRNVTITGEVRDNAWEHNDMEYDDGMEYVWIENFNLNLRKGWNIIYARHTRTTAGNVVTSTYAYTSQRPVGVNLLWRVDAWYDGRSAHSATTRATENRMSFFIR